MTDWIIDEDLPEGKVVEGAASLQCVCPNCEYGKGYNEQFMMPGSSLRKVSCKTCHTKFLAISSKGPSGIKGMSFIRLFIHQILCPHGSVQLSKEARCAHCHLSFKKIMVDNIWRGTGNNPNKVPKHIPDYSKLGKNVAIPFFDEEI